jgi:O-glycosyl hydrolase
MMLSVNIAINTNTRYQEIEGFGTADYTANAPLDADPAYQKMFYQDLGASILRIGVNPMVTASSDGMMDQYLNFGPDLQANIKLLNFQQYDVNLSGQLAQASTTYGLDSFKLIGSTWSPPMWMKGPEVDWYSGQPDGVLPSLTYDGTQTSGGTLIDTPQNLQQFARYLAAYVVGFQQTYGIPFYAITIQNELVFDEPYDSCVYTPQIYVDAVKAVHNEFVADGISTILMGPEDVGVGDDSEPWLAWRQMQFINAVRADPEAAADLGIYSIHGATLDPRSPDLWSQYWNGRSEDEYPDIYGAWWTGISGDGKESWMTETSGQSQDWDGGLNIAENAQDALVQGNVSAWLYWQTSDGTPANEQTLTGGTDESSPKFAAAQQFFRYIRPGSYRVDVQGSDPNGIYVSAFVQDQQHTLTSVLINTTTTDETVNLSVAGVNLSSFNIDRRSDATDTFADEGPVSVVNGMATITIPAESVVTLQGNTLVIAPAPTGLTPTPGDGTVTLNWNPSAGADSYNVLVASVSGGPYTTLATDVTGTTYTENGLTDGTTYYYVVTAVNAAGTSQNSNEAASTPVAASAPVSLFSSNAAPPANLQNVNDPAIANHGGVELGLKFRSDVSGTVTAIRFWKGTLDTGPHTGELWSDAGQLLATATFTNETASGWQQVTLSQPVAITANTTYIVSYHTSASYIAYTPGALAQAGIDNAPLHGLQDGLDGRNSVYSYDFVPGSSVFPIVNNGQSPNYWVDVLFNPGVTASSIFAANSAPAAGLQNVFDQGIASAGGVELGLKFQSDLAGYITGVKFWKGSSTTGVQTGELWTSAGQLLATANFTNETAFGWQEATFSTPVAIAANTVYLISYHTTSPTIAYTPFALSGSGIDNPPLHALANGISGGNSVYSYDTTPGLSSFPTTYNGQSPNYWVDAIFQTTP